MKVTNFGGDELFVDKPLSFDAAKEMLLNLPRKELNDPCHKGGPSSHGGKINSPMRDPATLRFGHKLVHNRGKLVNSITVGHFAKVVSRQNRPDEVLAALGRRERELFASRRQLSLGVDVDLLAPVLVQGHRHSLQGRVAAPANMQKWMNR